jgi:hypothetical protein
MDTAAPTATPTDGGSDDLRNSWILIALTVLGVWLLFRKKDEEVESTKSNSLNSWSAFKATPLGQNIMSQLDDHGLSLSEKQVAMLDNCFKSFSDVQLKILDKASQFPKQTDLKKVLSMEEMKSFTVIRNKISSCLDEAINS